MRLADVAVAAPVRRTFTYIVPPEQAPRIGCRVMVPFGRRLLTGYVVGFPDDADINPGRLRAIRRTLDTEPVLGDDLLKLGFWLSDYYLAAPGEVLRAMLPARFNLRGECRVALVRVPAQKSLLPGHDEIVSLLQKGPLPFEALARRLQRAHLWREVEQLQKEGVVALQEQVPDRPAHKTALFVSLVENPGAGDRLTVPQRVALEKLARLPGPVRLAELQRNGVSPATVRSLQKKSLVRVEPRVVRRRPLHWEVPPHLEDLTLTADQESAATEIRRALAARRFQSFLLHGVTGSGKTEVYLHAISAAVREGRGALMLVPEIALTPALMRSVQSWFGDAVAILHSGLSGGERHDEWQRIRRGEARVVVGTRSAVFSPISGLGLIVVDEEHDPSYKQEDGPMYNGRDAALVRGRLTGAVVVLGSATPALETYFLAQSTRKHRYLELPQRIHRRALPAVHIVDMRAEFQKHGRAEVVSEPLRDSIAQRMERGEQVMVLLNRRGYAPLLLCRSCGNTATCDNCSVSLTYHRTLRKLVCHYCEAARPLPGACERCGGEYLQFVGEGTERIHELLVRLFPHAVVDRLDRDSARGRGNLQRILARFEAGETHILVGTQMIAKGHDFPRVTLVGVLNADAGLRVPDFRSAERTFQLITQVAGRSGRGEAAGEVIVQTYYPGHYALQAACLQDYAAFYGQEIRFRKLFSYPPFSAMACVLTQHADPEQARGQAALFAAELQAVLHRTQVDGRVRILGPAEALLGKLKGVYRFQILLKAASRKLLHQTLRAALGKLEAARRRPALWSIDIDPIQVA